MTRVQRLAEQARLIALGYWLSPAARASRRPWRWCYPCECRQCDRLFIGMYENGDFCTKSCLRLALPSVKAEPVIDRFWRYVSKPNGDDGCWPWTGTISHGYGVLSGTTRAAHRLAYELLVGPIPAGLTIDHTCHNDALWCMGGPSCPHRRCCNPAHLEPVTSAENTRRSATALPERYGA